jgi:hypothetical protein
LARKFIEAGDGEAWRDISRQFSEWISVSVPTLDSFGYSEDDDAEHEGRRFFTFQIPDQHGEKVALFDAWARTTKRTFGTASGAEVHLDLTT